MSANDDVAGTFAFLLSPGASIARHYRHAAHHLECCMSPLGLPTLEPHGRRFLSASRNSLPNPHNGMAGDRLIRASYRSTIGTIRCIPTRFGTLDVVRSRSCRRLGGRCAPVAQWIERWPPKPGALVRLQPGVLLVRPSSALAGARSLAPGPDTVACERTNAKRVATRAHSRAHARACAATKQPPWRVGCRHDAAHPSHPTRSAGTAPSRGRARARLADRAHRLAAA